MIFERVIDPTEIASDQIAGTIAEFGTAVIQFSERPRDREILRDVDALCRKHGDVLEVRFYGHYSAPFDASVLRLIPNVQNLSLDCLLSTGPLDALFGLTNLRKLSLGIFELTDAEILTKIGIGDLREFSIGETRRGQIDLSPLAQCAHLERLYVEAQTKGLSDLKALRGLKDLTLRRVGKNHSIAFVSYIPHLERLKIILGGRADIAELHHPHLKELEIVWVRGFADVGDLGRFPSLRSLWVEDQLQLKSIDLASAPIGLQRVVLLNCKKLTSIGSLEKFDNLRQMNIGCTAINFEAVLATLPKSVRGFGFFEGRRKRDAEIKEKLTSLGYEKYTRPPL